jgi:drug/metabolite transporter (DMT)-like permease
VALEDVSPITIVWLRFGMGVIVLGAMMVAFFVLGEAITAASLLGGAIILIGVWLVNKS